MDDTDRWVVRCSDFATASQYAADQNWSLREWTWLPAYTGSKAVQVFERVGKETVTLHLYKYGSPRIDPLREYGGI